MIDIGSLAANALWILGLALILAALSWTNWVAARERIPFRSALSRTGVRRALDGGLVLLCAGLAATGRTRWEQVLWGALAVGFGAMAIWDERVSRHHSELQRRERMQREWMLRSESRPQRKEIGRWALGFGVAALSLWLLVRDLDWSGVWRAFGAADYRWVAVGIAAIIGTFFTRTRRWQALLWHTRVPARPAMTALLVGQVVNLALPMRSGDVARAAWIAPERGTGFPEALGSIAVEKVWDLLALLACGLVLLVWLPLPDWFARSTEGTALALLVGGGALWAGLHWQETLFHWAGRLLARFPVGWDRTLLPLLRRLTNGLEGLRRPGVSGQALLWTALTWGLGALANWAVLAAFGIPSAAAALFLLAALMVGGTVPVPGRLGLFEGICVLSLALFDVPRDLALAVGLVLHLVVMGPPLAGAALLALWPGRLRKASP